jgi:hypothetical protein
MNVSVTITGMDKVLKINEILMDKNNYIELLDAVAQDTLNLAKKYAPVDTGVLEAGGIKQSIENSRIVSFDNIPYAKYMEYGTRYFPVGDEVLPRARTSTSGKPCFHPFLRSAMYQIMQMLPEYFNNSILKKIE